MTNQTHNTEILGGIENPVVFECECIEDKKYRLVFDDGSKPYVVEYCQKCFDQDDKQFMLSMEELK